MLPDIWIFDSYSLMIIIGIILTFIVLDNYLRAKKVPLKAVTCYEILAIIAILFGFASAMLFQFIYDKIADSSSKFNQSMTFYGGLIGGVISYILSYYLYARKRYGCYFNEILKVAPVCITLSHGFGRIGCFLAGCCYGKQTNSFFGVKFPFLDYKVYPTQLYEAFFLFILCFIMYILLRKKDFRYNFVLYLFSYGVFRFLIENIRGDYRGFVFLSMSPSQIQSILIIIISIGLFFLIKFHKIIKK